MLCNRLLRLPSVKPIAAALVLAVWCCGGSKGSQPDPPPQALPVRVPWNAPRTEPTPRTEHAMPAPRTRRTEHAMRSEAPTSPRERPAPNVSRQPIALAAAEEEIELHPLPLPARAMPENVRVSGRGNRLTIQAIDASLGGLLAMIAEQHDLNIVSGDLSDHKITVTLHDVDLDDAFNAILAVKGYTWSRQKNIVIISSLDGAKKSTSIQGREVRVYNLNYILAADVEGIVNGLLSPVGQAFTTKTTSGDQRQTHEQLVVEDLPANLRQIESYLVQADIPPRQVLVEAHVLQVSLQDNLRHGIDFNNMMRFAGSEISLESPGFASDVGPTTVLRLKGGDLSGLLEAIKTTTDAKTLASPKVAVLNGQEARMQVGGQIGYLLTTTTQTSTLQSVNFLDVGVILSVTPIITDDHQVLLQVRPQVSTGGINATTQLPESETTEVQTNVMLADGEAMIIGGLIQEIDTDSQNKIPLLGDIKYVGRFFQKRSVKRERNEIIIALIPHIIAAEPYCREPNPAQVDQALTPLLHGPLKRVDRRYWEPQLPDAARDRREQEAYEQGCTAAPPFHIQY